MTHYELLGISPEATREEIKQAYRKRALETHPDLRRGRPAEIKQASRQFVRISKAYKSLIDPRRRAKYDNKLHQRAVAAAARATGRRVINRGRRIIPPTPPTPAEPSRVREDLREIDRLRREIWKESREVLVRRFILSLVLLAVLAAGNCYALFQDSDIYWPVLRVTFGVGLIVAYGAWLRFSRIWTGGGPVTFLSTDLRRRKTRRRSIPDWVNPFWLLSMVGLLGIAGISGMTIVEFREVESSMVPASVAALVVSLVAVVVLCWRAFSRR